MGGQEALTVFCCATAFAAVGVAVVVSVGSESEASNRIHKTTSTEEEDAVQNAFCAAPRRDSVGVALCREAAAHNGGVSGLRLAGPFAVFEPSSGSDVGGVMCEL